MCAGDQERVRELAEKLSLSEVIWLFSTDPVVQILFPVIFVLIVLNVQDF